MIELFNNVKDWFQQYPFLYDNLKFFGILALSYAAYLITRRIIFGGVKKLVTRTKTDLDDILLRDKLMRRLSLIVPMLVINYFAHTIPEIEELIKRVTSAAIVLLFLLSIGSVITSVNIYLERQVRFKERSIKGYLQITKIVLYILGIIFIVGVLTGQSPWTLLTGIGALTAVIILIFRDTILSFVASIQISSYDLVKVGDWIEMPKYGADGDVIDIALHTIKVQNWDKTITVIPTYKLVEDSFKNWRGMRLAGGRRIMRSIYLDQSSIKFVDDDLLERFKKIRLISGYVKERKAEIDKYNSEKKIDISVSANGRKMTNIGTFREYLKAYLRDREDIHNNLTFLVRQLEPGEKGIPIQIYVFAKTTEWAVYEDIQANLFDHILAIVPEFDLRIFQNPSGADIRSLISKNSDLKN